jgi:hypothetical protein
MEQDFSKRVSAEKARKNLFTKDLFVLALKSLKHV